MSAAITEAVQAGAALLDDKRPGWESEIKLDKLNLRDSRSCILGQLYGSYFGNLREITPDSDEYTQFDAREAFAQRHGFAIQYNRDEIGVSAYTSFADRTAIWDELQAAWVGLIEERRAA